MSDGQVAVLVLLAWMAGVAGGLLVTWGIMP
jgi:hypothetical protein